MAMARTVASGKGVDRIQGISGQQARRVKGPDPLWAGSRCKQPSESGRARSEHHRRGAGAGRQAARMMISLELCAMVVVFRCWQRGVSYS